MNYAVAAQWNSTQKENQDALWIAVEQSMLLSKEGGMGRTVCDATIYRKEGRGGNKQEYILLADA